MQARPPVSIATCSPVASCEIGLQHDVRLDEAGRLRHLKHAHSTDRKQEQKQSVSLCPCVPLPLPRMSRTVPVSAFCQLPILMPPSAKEQATQFVLRPRGLQVVPFGPPSVPLAQSSAVPCLCAGSRGCPCVVVHRRLQRLSG